MLDGCTRMVLSLRTITNKLPRTIYLQACSCQFQTNQLSPPPSPPPPPPPASCLRVTSTRPPPTHTYPPLQVFLRMAFRYGLPDQLITDKGREWALVVFLCYAIERLHNPRPPAGGGPRARRAHRAWRLRRRPHRYVKSKRNVRRSARVH
jgi:hypothetical protein